MTQEEKAKAYDDAIKRAKRMFSEKELNYLFPELAESDDEKIISAIRKAIEAKVENLGNGVTRTACLAWLEKQEDKDSQVKLPTFTFDDILALQCCMETVKKVQEDKDLYEKLNDIHGRVYDAYHLEKQGKPVEINPSEFDSQLNKLLKQFESLPKEELINSLSFYLNVVQNNGTYKSDEKQGEQNHTERSEENEHLRQKDIDF